ncbi:MAG: Ppx/GppA family phosphatase, partial [Cyanobacteria bacterium P01_C01_bin.121]
MIDTIAADLSAVASPLKPNSSSPLPIGDRLKGKDGAEFVLAAIDIGTNSIHMVVVSIDPSLPSFNIIGKEKDTVRLGDFCEATGDLTEEAMLRGINSLKRCLQVANSFNADDIVAVATSAVREAG